MKDYELLRLKADILAEMVDSDRRRKDWLHSLIIYSPPRAERAAHKVLGLFVERVQERAALLRGQADQKELADLREKAAEPVRLANVPLETDLRP